jgi:hypothetical protein
MQLFPPAWSPGGFLLNTKSLWISFWPVWILANAVGWFTFTGTFLASIFGWGFPLIAALILGLLQWAVLQRYLRVDWRWSVASLTVYGSIFYAAYLIPGFFTLLFVQILSLGLLGYLQYRVLDEVVAGASSWVFISPFAGLLGFGIAIVLGRLPLELFGQFWLVQGLIYGLISGAGLILFMTIPA